MDVARATDNELIEAARGGASREAELCLNELYRRFYPRVAYWCLRLCGNRQEAGDLAQEVFLRVHSKLDSFRMDSRFSTWLYTVARSVAINRGVRASRQERGRVDLGNGPDPADPRPSPSTAAEQGEMLERVRKVMQSELDPLEAKVVYMHHVQGLTLPAITELLELRNKSGAKAHMVSGMRKLRRCLRDTGSGGREAAEYT